MKMKSLMKAIGMVLLITSMLTACSGSKMEMKSDSVSPEYSTNQESKPGQDSAANGLGMTESIVEDTAGSTQEGQDVKDKATNTSQGTNPQTSVDTNRKLIRKLFFQLETQDFDNVITIVNTKIKKSGGYVETSTTNADNYYKGTNTRVSDLVVRIPQDQLEDFINTVSEIGNIISKEESAKDVTLEYVDIESHKKSLLIEQERLLFLLGKTEYLDDIISLESRLSEVRYQIEAYESNLRTLDNLVDYSTVTLRIYEVERISAPKVITATDRMKTGLSDSIYKLSKAAVDFVVWLVVNLPFIIIWVLIILGFIIAYKKIRKNINKNGTKEKLFHKDQGYIKVEDIESDDIKTKK